MKHTPEPWLAEFGECYCVRAQRDGGRVALITNLKGMFGMAGRRSEEESAANTLIIAAAPRMASVLQRAAHILAELQEQSPEILQLRTDIVDCIKEATPEYYGTKSKEAV
jgi:hypothetical protein